MNRRIREIERERERQVDENKRRECAKENEQHA